MAEAGLERLQRHARRHLRRALGLVLRALMAIAPTRHLAVVAAYPSDEGNAVEVVRSLTERYPGRVLWIDAPDPGRLAALHLAEHRIERVDKRDLRAIWAFVTAEVVFSTHGVYGCPRPVRGKAMVNLWHGDGPKGHAGAPVPSTYLVSGSGVFGRRLATTFGVAHRDLLLTGLPRTAQLRETPGAGALTRLGIDPERPYVVWMPTVRQLGAAGVNSARSDTTDPEGDIRLAELIAPGARVLADLGIQLIVKPHPIDLVSRTFDGFSAVSDQDLDAAGTTVYAFLGGAAGLITDYSSVWTDYLALDRPIGFFTPDLAAYRAGRGIMDGSLDELPGAGLDSEEAFAAFGLEVLGRSAAGAGRRRRAREVFELTHPDRPADDLLDELASRGALSLDDRPARTPSW